MPFLCYRVMLDKLAKEENQVLVGLEDLEDEEEAMAFKGQR